MNNRRSLLSIFTIIFSFLFLSLNPPAVFADGTETLGPPIVDIASGSDIIAAGTGLATQPGDISFDVPAGATVEQVLLYWEGQDLDSFTGDNTIIVNNNTVTGTQIGGPVFWLDDGVSTTYRADITGLVGPGANTLTVEGLNFTNFANGAGVLVIIDDGSSPSNIEIRDGNDLAFITWPAPKDTTVAQTFTFAASSEERTGTISMLFSAVSGTNSSGGDFRPTAIDITVGGVTVTYNNLLDSLDGQEWDTVVLPVVIPAGETEVTVQALSVDNEGIGGLPASLTWNAAGLSVPPPSNCSIGDYVWEDADRDGCQDPDERPIEGVEVKLRVFDECGGSLLEIKKTETDEDGFYEFIDLDCNKEYRVKFGDAGDIYAYTEKDSCTVGDPPEPSDTKDSDCNTNGLSGCVTFPDPVNNPNNPTIDCGYVCEGEIGDRVWLDTNGNTGCQDPDEPGIKSVTVNLFEVEDCPDVDGLTPDKTLPTVNGGIYTFTELCPGDYRVTFDIVPQDRTVDNAACDDDTLIGGGGDGSDSDCGTVDECVTLTAGNPVDLTIDCGKRPPDCALTVDKKCQVEPPATGPFECKDKVDALKMIWNGEGTLQSVEALPGGNDSFPVGEITVENGDQVVTVTNYQPSSNDVIWNWESNIASGQSKFHLSCSDDEMDGPEDCGNPQGNGKSNEDEFANVWLLDGLATDEGFVFDCTPQPAAPSDNCEFEATPVPGCKTDPEVNNLTSITFRYTGEDCSASDNDQGDIGDKWDCVGDPGADPVNIVVIKDTGKTSSDKDSVNVGDTFTLSDDFSSESIVKVGDQMLTFHTSCSQPLAVDDVFGSLEVVGINGLSPGAEVTYFYEVKNVGGTVAEVTSVSDDKLGELLNESRELNPNGSFTLEETAFISETTKNTVTVQGNVADSIFECSGASDTVTVEVKEPTCEVSIRLDKIEDKKIKWKLSNSSSIPATIGTLTITWPGSTNLKKIKFDGNDILKDVALSSPATIDQWLKEPKDRTLKAGDTDKKLEIEFTENFPDKKDQDPDDFDLTVTFEQGCGVSF